MDISNIRNRLEERHCLWTLAPTATQRKGEGGYADCLLQKLEHTCCCKDLTQCSSRPSSTRKSCRSIVNQMLQLYWLTLPSACNPWSQSVCRPKATSSNQLPRSLKHEAGQTVLCTRVPVPAPRMQQGSQGTGRYTALWGRKPDQLLLQHRQPPANRCQHTHMFTHPVQSPTLLTQPIKLSQPLLSKLALVSLSQQLSYVPKQWLLGALQRRKIVFRQSFCSLKVPFNYDLESNLATQRQSGEKHRLSFQSFCFLQIHSFLE